MSEGQELYLTLAAECDERARRLETGDMVAVVEGQDVSRDWAAKERDSAEGWRRAAEFFRAKGWPQGKAA
jgi:hypothetical protein